MGTVWCSHQSSLTMSFFAYLILFLLGYYTSAGSKSACKEMSVKCIKIGNLTTFVEDQDSLFSDPTLSDISCVPCCNDSTYVSSKSHWSSSYMSSMCMCAKIQKPKHVVGCAYMAGVGEKMIRMEGKAK